MSVKAIIVRYGKQIPVEDEDGQWDFEPIKYSRAVRIVETLSETYNGYSVREVSTEDQYSVRRIRREGKR